jgi:predicted site-specific integrase-resolvase
MINKIELAKELGVSMITINRHMKLGMPFIKTPTGRVRFELEEVYKWLRGEK